MKISTEGSAGCKSRSQRFRFAAGDASSAECASGIAPTIAVPWARDDNKLGLRFELLGRSWRECSTRCSWRVPAVRDLSRSAIRSASMLDPPALMRMNSIEIPERPRIARTWAMARKNHEFTSTKSSVRSPRSSKGTVSMHSMQHPPRPRSRTRPRSSDPLKGRDVICAKPLQE